MPAVLDFTVADVIIGTQINGVIQSPIARIEQNIVTFNGQRYVGIWKDDLTFDFYTNPSNSPIVTDLVRITLYAFATVQQYGIPQQNYSFKGQTAIYETREDTLNVSNLFIEIPGILLIKNLLLFSNHHIMQGVWANRTTFKYYNDLVTYNVVSFNESNQTGLIKYFDNNGQLYRTDQVSYTGSLTAGTTPNAVVDAENVSLKLGDYDVNGNLSGVAYIRSDYVNFNHSIFLGDWLDNYTYKFYTSSIDFIIFQFNSSNNNVVATRTDGSLYRNLNWQGNLPGTPPITPICFNKGTKILCLNNDLEEEYIVIEKLKPGDLVKSFKHGYRRIVIVHESFLINDPTSWNNCMYKMSKNEENGLTEDLIVTGGHSILVDDLSEHEDDNDMLFLGETPKIDGKYLLLAGVANTMFEKVKDNRLYNYYHFVLENNGDDEERYGIWANGALTETPSKRFMLSVNEHTLF